MHHFLPVLQMGWYEAVGRMSFSRYFLPMTMVLICRVSRVQLIKVACCQAATYRLCWLSLSLSPLSPVLSPSLPSLPPLPSLRPYFPPSLALSLSLSVSLSLSLSLSVLRQDR